MKPLVERWSAILRYLLFLTAFSTLRTPLHAGVGTEGAAFLNIPVGGGPAALGGAYTALAEDAYAPTWNPAGLGYLDSTQMSGQHLSYLGSNHYEYVSFVHPLNRSPNCNVLSFCPSSGIGGSAQYFGSGDIVGTDEAGNPTGNFSNHYATYNIAYGKSWSEKWSWGLTGKWINAQLENVSANAFAGDFGGLYQPNRHITLGATLANLGSKLKFLNEGDSLPLALHLGSAWFPNRDWTLSAEAVYAKTGQLSGHGGLEWQPIEFVSLRTGYRTDTVKGLAPLAGFTTGLGIHLWRQELDYAWLPMGDLGNTQYVSAIVRFNAVGRNDRNLVVLPRDPVGGRASNWRDYDDEQVRELFERRPERMANSTGAAQ